MKVREFIQLEEDIDVYDDVCEELAICFCGPAKLTAEGEKYFSDVLGMDVTIFRDGENVPTALIAVDDGCEVVAEWKPRLRKAIEFFNAAAGYCSEADYDRWFCE